MKASLVFETRHVLYFIQNKKSIKWYTLYNKGLTETMTYGRYQKCISKIPGRSVCDIINDYIPC